MNYSQMSNCDIIKKFAIPQMIGLVFNSIYFIIDGIFIGQKLGSDALAAAGIAIPIVEIMIALSMLISVGSGVIISSQLGEGKTEDANKMFNKANLITIVFAICIVLLGNLFIEPIARFMGATDLIITDTIVYLRYFITASPFLIFSFTLSTFARNDNAPKLAMWALIVGSLSNIILDWFFMYPLDMGMGGAALATALGPVFSVTILLHHFLKKKGTLHFKVETFKIMDVVEIGRKGASAFITNFSIGLVTLFYNLAINHNNMGEITLSAYVIIGYLALIALTAFLGASQGIQPAISYYSGSGEKDRIKSLSRFSIVFNIMLGIILMIIIWIFGSRIIGLFTTDQNLNAYTNKIASLYFLNLVFAAANIMIATILQALNHQKYSTYLSLMRSTVPLIGLLWLLPILIGSDGIWYAVTLVECMTLVTSYIIWKKVMATNYETTKGLETASL